MTKQEIKDLIAAKIAGQGNQVDIGNALAEVLNALADNVDAAQQAANNIKVLDLTPYAEQIENNEPIPNAQDLLDALYGVVELKLPDGLYPCAGVYASPGQDYAVPGTFYGMLLRALPAGFILDEIFVGYGSVQLDYTGIPESWLLIVPCAVRKDGVSYAWFCFLEV